MCNEQKALFFLKNVLVRKASRLGAAACFGLDSGSDKSTVQAVKMKNSSQCDGADVLYHKYL
jgi:hypothetical protein